MLWLTPALLFACHPTTPVPTATAAEPIPAPAEPSEPEPEPAPAPPPSQAAPACAAAPGWRPERIALPPAFAPSLPAGEELLWFAPGMFDADADDYFSYVFELALEEAPTADPAELRDLLHAYYAGLMQAVAKGSERTPGEVSVDVQPAKDGHFAAVIEMTDEFTGGAPVSVEIDLERTNTCLIATVTPSSDAQVRAGLARARTCLPCAAR